MNYNNQRKMSLRACNAYDWSSEKKITDFGKADRDELVSRLNSLGYEIESITVPQMRRWLKSQGESSWHHTGQSYRKTSFYSIEYALTGMIGQFKDEDVDMDSIEELMVA